MTKNELTLGVIRKRLPMSPSQIIVDPYYIRVMLGDIHVVFIKEFKIIDKNSKYQRHIYCENKDETKVEVPELKSTWSDVKVVGHEFIIDTEQCEARIDLDLQIEAVIVHEGNETYLTFPEDGL
ncbi:hypothetical protein [Maricaulis sp.]|uniref:hypothetical protein n=1 Tax=Maricaulis sp. TaxID=1486257 RepID=UPI003A8CD471